MTVTGSLFWRSQARRRLAVACLYLGYGGILTFTALIARGVLPRVPGFLLIGLSGLATLFGLAGAVQSRRTLFTSVSGVLDERQRAIRDRAYYAAYQALGLVSISAAVYLSLLYLDLAAPILAPTQMVILIGTGVLLLATTLPSAMMAWTEPDPPEDSGAHYLVNRPSL